MIQGIAFIMILLSSLSSVRPALAESHQVTWKAVTSYTNGIPIDPQATVTYTLYWSNDPWLAVDTLRILTTSTTATSVTFDPAVQGMTAYQEVYFTTKSVMDTGVESEFSEVVPWNPPSPAVATVMPMPVDSLGITTLSGMWKLFWDPVTRYTNGNTIEANTVNYTLYWTTDGALSPESLMILGSSIPETSFEFDPKKLGINGNQRIFFTARTMLTTGEESALSDSVSMRLSNEGPGTPKNGRIRRYRK